MHNDIKTINIYYNNNVVLKSFIVLTILKLMSIPIMYVDIHKHTNLANKIDKKKSVESLMVLHLYHTEVTCPVRCTFYHFGTF